MSTADSRESERRAVLLLASRREADSKQVVESYGRTPQSQFETGLFSSAVSTGVLRVFVGAPDAAQRPDPAHSVCSS